MTLYELTQERAALYALLNELEGELTEENEEAIDQWLRESKELLQQKVDAYCVVIQEKIAQGEARKKEAERLAALAVSDLSSAKRLKQRLLHFLKENDTPKMETPRFKLRVSKNGGVQKLLLPEAWLNGAYAPECYHKHVIEVDTVKVRDDLRLLEQYRKQRDVLLEVEKLDSDQVDIIQQLHEDIGYLERNLNGVSLAEQGEHLTIK